MKFCSECGHTVSLKTPENDNRPRYVCDACDYIHYQNPRIVTGCLPVWENRVLLCRRAIEPRRGYWTLPAGFMENGETSLEGALRETWEEAEAEVIDTHLYRMFDLPYINQVYIFFRGTLRDGEFGVGVESLETALFHEADIPWQELAFPIVSETLQDYFADRKSAEFPVRISEVNFPGLRRKQKE